MDNVIQMNTRIEQSLKREGDAALSLIGLNPSQAVRALWRKAARRGEDLQQVAQLLEADGAQSAQGGEAQAALAAGWELMDDFVASRGWTMRESDALAGDDELLEEFWEERLGERGLA